MGKACKIIIINNNKDKIMPILNIVPVQIGAVGIKPNIAVIETNDTLATVVTTGYLNKAQQNGASLSESTMCLVSTKTSPSSAATAVGWLEVSHVGADWSLIPSSAPGTVVLPTIASHIATYTDATGTLSEDAATAINGGNIQAGLSGTAGFLASFPSAALKGSLRLTGVANTGDTVTTISNAAMGQASVISIPDSGAATANFLLDAGTANILAQQQFVGLGGVLTFGTGTWTVTRIAQGNYVSRHTPGDETSIIAVDITPAIRVAAGKGFRLDSFDVVYAIAANALDAQSVVLDRIEYANNVAVSVNTVAITGTLATATQANPYVTNVVVDVPAFDITADSKYVIELTVDNAAASEYDYYGVMLRFSQTVA